MLKLILFLMLFLSHSLFANAWNDLWYTKDQQAKKALDLGDTETAIKLFENSFWRATAEYKAGDFSASAESFRNEYSKNGLYNYANSLVKLGRFPEALEVYERVIEGQPDAVDAIYNRDLIKKLIEEQEDNQNESELNQPSDENKQSDPSEEQIDDESQSSDSQQSDDQSSSESDEEGNINQEEMNQDDLDALERELKKAQDEADQNEPDDLDQIMSAERRSEQEQEQAMEQWLRRISDDPGGLLRRKFRYQYQRQGFDQDGNQLWPDDGVQPW
ncbi:MAG: hypothetical protein P8I76_01285 [Woeseiaceae bacterium]|nr:hypothetical protein [Woeseiaceae bacterium]